jgi:hypothetical protein
MSLPDFCNPSGEAKILEYLNFEAYASPSEAKANGDVWRRRSTRKKQKNRYEDFRLRGESELKAQCGEQQECSPRGTPLALGPHLVAPSRDVIFVLKCTAAVAVRLCLWWSCLVSAPIKSNSSVDCLASKRFHWMNSHCILAERGEASQKPNFTKTSYWCLCYT